MESIISETESRLLEAAGQVFAERGFAAATVRDICERAQANVAAINYHFGDKRGLYRAVFRHASACGQTEPGVDELVGPGAIRLRAWTERFLYGLVAKDSAGWPGRLLAREFADPSPALSEFIEHGGRPVYDLLIAIIMSLAPNLPAARLHSCAASIIGQVIFYHHAKPFIEVLAPAQVLTTHNLQHIAEHITAFSLAAIAHLESLPVERTS
jgi:AcrR family transcriptional regulator